MSLRTDYVNDELAPSMDGRRQYEQVENANGTVGFIDRTAYAKVGSNFGAEDLNATNREVNTISENLTALGNSDKIYSGTVVINSTYSIEDIENYRYLFLCNGMPEQILASQFVPVDVIKKTLYNKNISLAYYDGSSYTITINILNKNTFKCVFCEHSTNLEIYGIK